MITRGGEAQVMSYLNLSVLLTPRIHLKRKAETAEGKGKAKKQKTFGQGKKSVPKSSRHGAKGGKYGGGKSRGKGPAGGKSGGKGPAGGKSGGKGPAGGKKFSKGKN